MVKTKIKRDERGTAVTVLVLGMLLIFGFSIIAQLFYMYGKVAYSQRVVNEKLALRAQENVSVERGVDENENRLFISNGAGNVVIIKEILYETSGAIVADEAFELVGTLEQKYVPVSGDKLAVADHVGVLTNLGNVYWAW